MTKIKKKSPEDTAKPPANLKPSGKVKKRFYKKQKKNATKVALPVRPELVSANWKALMTTITDKSKNSECKLVGYSLLLKFLVIFCTIVKLLFTIQCYANPLSNHDLIYLKVIVFEV